MFNQSCSNNNCGQWNSSWDQNQMFNNDMSQWNQMNSSNDQINGCPRPQTLIAPRRVCVTNQITPVPQHIICPIECRRVNHCMRYPVFCPQYEQTFMTMPFMN